MQYNPTPGLLYDAMCVCALQIDNSRFHHPMLSQPVRDMRQYVLNQPLDIPSNVRVLFSFHGVTSFLFYYVLEKGLLTKCPDGAFFVRRLTETDPDEMLERLFFYLHSQHDAEPPDVSDPQSVARFIDSYEDVDPGLRYALLLVYNAPRDALRGLGKVLEQALDLAGRLRTAFADDVQSAVGLYADRQFLLDLLEEGRVDAFYSREDLLDPSKTVAYSLSFLNAEVFYVAAHADQLCFLFGAQMKELYGAGAQEEVQLGRLGRALADPKRLEVLELLKRRPHYGQEICHALDIMPNNLTYHIEILASCDLIEIARVGRRVYYGLNVPYYQKVSDYFLRLYGELQTSFSNRPFPPEDAQK